MTLMSAVLPQAMLTIRVAWVCLTGALLALCGRQSTALMFQSHAVTSQWDTWAFVENGTFYVGTLSDYHRFLPCSTLALTLWAALAYYLITEHSPGEGFGVATSPNGVTNWTDHGYVWHSPDWAEHRWWEGTGAVWRARDFEKTGRYVINYSRCPGKYQQITFAESYDLIHWTRPAPFNTTIFNISEPEYKNPGRWDCIYSTPQDPILDSPRDGYPRYGWWTATAANSGGDMGFGRTEDGWTWEALPSPTMIPPISSEVGAVEYIVDASGENGRWFAMLGHGGMTVYSATSPEGPYTIQSKNPVVLSGSCYFSRFFRAATGNTVFVTHQAYSHQGRTYIAPYKRVEVDTEGILRFKYFDLDGDLLNNPLPVGSNNSAPWFAVTANVTVGAAVTLSLDLPTTAAASPSDYPGIAFEMVDGTVVFLAIDTAGRCTVGTATLNDVGSPTMTKVLGTWDRELVFPAGAPVHVQVLFRRDMLELYLNDYLLPVQLMPQTSTGRFGVLTNANAHRIKLTAAFALNLPGAAVWPPLPPAPAPSPPPPPGDLSPNGTAGCSGVYSPAFACRLGTDGVLTTRWSSELPYDGTSRWLAVHFDTATTVRSAVLAWELAYAKGYALQVANSTDGASLDSLSWSTFYNTTNGRGGTETLRFDDVIGTDFRIFCYERFPGSAWGFSLYELELFA